jgi:cytochrome d ubiquinol oxidase subunit I
MDVTFLARIQFGLTAGFHYLFPPLSIGLGVILVILMAMWVRTGEARYERLARFWTKIFGITFALGVSTGIVLEFQFGTNWATYSRFVGDVFGSPLAAEAMFAFFLESSFLAVLVFGWGRVSPRMHLFAATMVCLGAHLSAVWIVVANSWQQTPAGYHLVVTPAGHLRAEITDFWAMVWNPSTVDRLTHVFTGAWQAAAWLVISVSAYYLLRKRHLDFARTSMKIGLAFALVASLGQLLTGHHSAMTVAKYQPAKLAAFEGHYPRSAPGDLYLLGWVNEKTETVTGLKVPRGLSWLVHLDGKKPVTGLTAFERRDRPPVNAVFQAYHVMVVIGFGLIGLSGLGVLLWLWGGRLFETRWLLWLLVPSVLLPQIANQVGWFSAEVGRQPWIVHGLLRTQDAASKVVTAPQVVGSIIMFSVIYLVLLAAYLFLMTAKILHGPEEPPAAAPEPEPAAPAAGGAA